MARELLSFRRPQLIPSSSDCYTALLNTASEHVCAIKPQSNHRKQVGSPERNLHNTPVLLLCHMAQLTSQFNKCKSTLPFWSLNQALHPKVSILQQEENKSVWKTLQKQPDHSQSLFLPLNCSRHTSVKAYYAWAKSHEKVLLELCQNSLSDNPGTNPDIKNMVLLGWLY